MPKQVELTIVLDQEWDGRPEDAAKVYLNAHDWKMVVWDLDQELRTIAKYSEDEQHSDWGQKLRSKLYDILRDYDLTLD